MLVGSSESQKESEKEFNRLSEQKDAESCQGLVEAKGRARLATWRTPCPSSASASRCSRASLLSYLLASESSPRFRRIFYVPGNHDLWVCLLRAFDPKNRCGE